MNRLTLLTKHGPRLLVAVMVLMVAGCARGCTSSSPPIHLNPNMDNQPKYRAQEKSEFFYDAATMRSPVEGTVARGELVLDDEKRLGKAEDGEFVGQVPYEIDDQLMARGKERYEIYCVPCHGVSGDGQGVLWERGSVATPSLFDERIVNFPAGQLYDVVTNGLGLMPGYAYPIDMEDRWAIVAYVRKLQSEQAR